MNMGIGKRLFLGFLALLFLEAWIIIFGITNLNILSQLNQRSISLAEPAKAIYDLSLSLEKLTRPINDYLVHGNIIEKSVFKIYDEDAKKHIQKVKELFSSERHTEFIKTCDTSLLKAEEMANNIFKIERPIGNIEGAMLMEEMDAFIDKASGALDEYRREYLNKQLNILTQESGRIVKRSQVFFLSFSFLSFLLSFVLSYFLMQRIRGPIVSLWAACKKLSKGEMADKIELKTKDEFEELATTFNEMADEIREREETIKQDSKELAEWSRLLEQRVEEKTRELEVVYERISQSEKMAALGQLSAGMAHEINNPLTAILIETEMLFKDKDQDKDTKDALRVVLEQSNRIKEIIDRVFRFSHKKEFEQNPLNINAILEKTIPLLNYQVEMGNIEIVKKLELNLPKIRGDDNQMQEVFLNIMLNAIEAMSAKGKLTIRTRCEKVGLNYASKTDVFKQGQELAVIEFEDTGRGMDDETLKKIFNPFFSTKAKGLGLGLSICYQIIKSHKGLIEVQSKLGIGSTFIIKLPIMQGGVKDEEKNLNS